MTPDSYDHWFLISQLLRAVFVVVLYTEYNWSNKNRNGSLWGVILSNPNSAFFYTGELGGGHSSRSLLTFISIVLKSRKKPVFLSLTNRWVWSNWKEIATERRISVEGLMLGTGKNEVHRADVSWKTRLLWGTTFWISHCKWITIPKNKGVGVGKTYSFLQGFAERTHRLPYYLQTKNLAQIHLRKAIKSFPHFQK